MSRPFRVFMYAVNTEVKTLKALHLCLGVRPPSTPTRSAAKDVDSVIVCGSRQLNRRPLGRICSDEIGWIENDSSLDELKESADDQQNPRFPILKVRKKFILSLVLFRTKAGRYEAGRQAGRQVSRQIGIVPWGCAVTCWLCSVVEGGHLLCVYMCVRVCMCVRKLC